jgi:hypothetical protein
MAESSENDPDPDPEPGESEASLFQRMKEKAKGVQSSVAEKIAETSEAAQDKFREKLGELNELLPAIRELGYSVNSVQIGIGLLPDVSIDVSGLARTMDVATYERVLEEQKNNKVITLILKTLQTASAWQQKIQLISMGCDQATITLGLPPKLTLKFQQAAP